MKKRFATTVVVDKVVRGKPLPVPEEENMRNHTVPKRVWLRGSFEVLNTTAPTALMAHSCQALEKETQRAEYLSAEAVSALLAALPQACAMLKSFGPGTTGWAVAEDIEKLAEVLK